MSHARLTHPDRPTIEFRQGQVDQHQTAATTNVSPQIGQDRPTLVHIESRTGARTIRGRVTAPRRARNDPDTSDWRQALANYIDHLEAGVDEFQGDHLYTGGYTLVDDERDESLNCVFESIEWTLGQGQPFDIEYSASLQIGRGTLENRSVQLREPTVNTGMTVAATVDGLDLPGLREMEVRREIGVNMRGVYDRDTAERNDGVIESGQTQQIIFRGTHTGTQSQRASADANLEALIGDDDPVEFVTKFPGYTLEGFVTDYSSNLESRMGDSMHQFELTFQQGQRA